MTSPFSETLGYAIDKFIRLGVGRLRGIVEAPMSPTSLAMIAGAAIVFGVEIACMGYPRSSVYRLLHPTKTTFADMLFFFGKITAVSSLVITIFMLGLPTITAFLAERYLGWKVFLRIDNPVLRGIASFVITDFVVYWVHRARHGFGWWWELHKYHHSAEEFNGITAARGHPLDAGSAGVVSIIANAIFGGSIEDLVVIALLSGVHASLTHSMLDWSWGWFGKYVLYSPVGHRIHHSPLPEHMDKNFGAIFPLWDVIFGTFYEGDVVNEKVGVDSNDFNREGFLRDMVVAPKRAALATLGRAAPLRAESEAPAAGACGEEHHARSLPERRWRAS